jgi:hypothetical protein
MSRELSPEEIKEAVEHREVLNDICAVLATKSGRNFIKYLFKHLGASELPELGLTGDILMDKLGFLRAGNSIFKLVAEANHEAAGLILAENERWKNEQIYADEREE